MITYTKKNVNFLAFVITVLIFILFQIISSIFLVENQKILSPNSVYSKSIPIYLNNDAQTSIKITNNNLSQLSNNIIQNEKLEGLSNIITKYPKLLLGKTVLKSSIREIKTQGDNIDNSSSQNTEQIQNEIEVAETGDQNTTYKTQQKSNNTANSSTQVQQTGSTKTQRQYIQENKEIKWRIQIPKLNLDVHIQEGTTSDILLTSVGHFEDTSKWKGNVGLAAHNRGYQCNFFQEIKNLKEGDEIIYTTTNGKKVYCVQTNKIIPETDWSYLQETKDNRITLITCEENRKEYRRCVQAVEVANYIK